MVNEIKGCVIESNSVEDERYCSGPISPRSVNVERVNQICSSRKRRQIHMNRFLCSSIVCVAYLFLSGDTILYALAYKSSFMNQNLISGNLISDFLDAPKRRITNTPKNGIKPTTRQYFRLHNSFQNEEKIVDDVGWFENAASAATTAAANNNPTKLFFASEKPSTLETTTTTTTEKLDQQIYQRAIKQTIVWVVAAGLFGAGLVVFVDPKAGEEFYAGYLVEQSLSVDNLFVFLLLFDYFKVPIQNQNKVLNWGICGAVVMRAVMIGIGAAALHEFHAILLLFASFLVYSSVSILVGDGNDDKETDMGDDFVVKFSRRFINSVDEFDGDNFFTVRDGIKIATPLFLCMVAAEISDVVFAVDSIPAVFGVTENPLIVWSSNMFAILGLRSLYTILSKAASDLEYLEPAVAIVLGFIGSKLIAEYFGYCVPTLVSLLVVATVLSGGIILSIYENNNNISNNPEGSVDDAIDVSDN